MIKALRRAKIVRLRAPKKKELGLVVETHDGRFFAAHKWRLSDYELGKLERELDPRCQNTYRGNVEPFDWVLVKYNQEKDAYFEV